MDPIRLTLITQLNCSLCDSARRVIDRVRAAAVDRYDLAYEELSLADHPELAAQYSEYVPVVLVDGVQHASFTVREDKLARAIVAAQEQRDRNHGRRKRPGLMQRLRDRRNRRATGTGTGPGTERA